MKDPQPVSFKMASFTTFRNFSIDSLRGENDTNLMPINQLKDLDSNLEDWPVVLVSQLSLRDEIINKLYAAVEELVLKARKLEEDLDYLELKNLELGQERDAKIVDRKVEYSQTTEEDFAEAWNKWYSGCHPYDSSNVTSAEPQYSKDYESYGKESVRCESKEGTRKKTGHSKVKEKKKTSKKKKNKLKMDPDKVLDEENRKENEINSLEKLSDSIGYVDDEKKLESVSENDKRECLVHERDERVESLSGNSEKENYLESGNDERESLASEYDKNIDSLSGNSEKDNYLVSEQDKNVESMSEKGDRENYVSEWDERDNYAREEDKNVESMSGNSERGNNIVSDWDVSGTQSIAEQVAMVASHAVQDSGYVYDKKLGLYYDYSSGYYYNAENGLYYDGKTGTYFYYDHTSQSYQFHSQVPLNTSEEQEQQQQQRKNDRTRDNSLRVKNRKVRPRKTKKEKEDIEEGECTSSEDDLEDVSYEEDEEEEDEEQDEKNGGSPTLRLMVVESESDAVRVGRLDVVSVLGGTVGRDATNTVHFPDQSVSKIHAEIQHNSSGHDDHRFYIKDLGSRNGTLVNGVRLSEADKPSEPYEVKHGWLIAFGWIQVRCHIHKEENACNECRIGIPPSLMPSASNSEMEVPPSLRLMVVKSASEGVQVGSLHLVTVAGGMIGRETENHIQLCDEFVSKVHAEITYSSEGPDDHHYYLKDVGSTTGTYINKSRLSDTHQASQPVEIGHGFKLRLGGVEMECHIHRGHLTCNGCEPGIVLSNQPIERTISFTSKEKSRKKALKALRKKYGITTDNEKVVVSGQYVDRAEKRKKEVGSSNPYEKTEVASTEVPLTEKNKGFNLMKKMGWSAGESLGKSTKGITEPVNPVTVQGRAGLGSTHNPITAQLSQPVSKKQRKLWEKWNITTERYKNAPLIDNNNWTGKD